MRITIDAARTDLSTQRECAPERWNSRGGRASGTKEEVRILNAYLDTLQANVHEAHRSLLDQKDQVTIENIKKKLKGSVAKPRMILEIFQHHNDQVEQLLGKEFSAGTLERYNTSLDHTRSFLKWKYNVPDLDITRLDY